jgi:hypothetical protein
MVSQIPAGRGSNCTSNMPDRILSRAAVREADGAYIVGRVDGGERALEAAHLLAAHVGLTEVSPKQVIVAILNRRGPVVF